jgi:hypothetical protein
VTRAGGSTRHTAKTRDGWWYAGALALRATTLAATLAATVAWARVSGADRTRDWLTLWDAQWYARIAAFGYPRDILVAPTGDLILGHEFAFFPLFPGLAHLLHVATGCRAATRLPRRRPGRQPGPRAGDLCRRPRRGTPAAGRSRGGGPPGHGADAGGPDSGVCRAPLPPAEPPRVAVGAAAPVGIRRPDPRRGVPDPAVRVGHRSRSRRLCAGPLAPPVRHRQGGRGDPGGGRRRGGGGWSPSGRMSRVVPAALRAGSRSRTPAGGRISTAGPRPGSLSIVSWWCTTCR